MATEFRLPDPGEGIHEAEILEVCVAAGDAVQEGEIILHIETDKAVVEVPSPVTGTVAEIRVAKGEVVEVGTVLMTFTTSETAQDTRRQRQSATAVHAVAPAQQGASRPTVAFQEKTPPTRNGAAAPAKASPVPASPATRRLAMEFGVDLQAVTGSGPGGRVTAEDVRSFASQAEAAVPPAGARETGEGIQEEAAAPAEASAEQETTPQPGRPLVVERPPLPDFRRWGPVEEVPLHGVRRATARQMSLAWAQIPHVMHQDIADITALEMFRRRHAAEIEQRGGKLTLTVLVMQAVVAALKQFPRLNASLDPDGGRLILKHYYHIGVAVDTERGLLVPVVRDVDCKSMVQLAVELPALVERTRQGQVNRDELQGGTFTITNAGAIGGTAFTPIINYPEVAILGLARARLAPVVQGDVEHFMVDARWHLPLHLAFDHRVNDGADAARFVRMVIDVLHDPEALLLHI